MSIAEIYRGITSSGISQSPSPELRTRTDSEKLKGPSEFQEVLSREALSFSQHAETRIRSREIPWDSSLEKRVSQGIDTADKKGSREALILADNIAVIANVKSRTIITAMDRTQMKERIFTNIDSAVLV